MPIRISGSWNTTCSSLTWNTWSLLHNSMVFEPQGCVWPWWSKAYAVRTVALHISVTTPNALVYLTHVLVITRWNIAHVARDMLQMMCHLSQRADVVAEDRVPKALVSEFDGISIACAVLAAWIDIKLFIVGCRILNHMDDLLRNIGCRRQGGVPAINSGLVITKQHSINS